MANNRYIQRIQTAIRDLHGCESKHVETTAVREQFQGQTIWQGNVEVFELVGHPKAKRCYAWGEREKADGAKIVAVLEIPPVESAETAVKVSIVAEAKKGNQKRWPST